MPARNAWRLPGKCCQGRERNFAGAMHFTALRSCSVVGLVCLLAGCATADSGESAASSPREGAPEASTRPEAAAEKATATERAAADRRAPAAARESASATPAETAKLVDQLNEAARELATLRTANAKLRAERERPRPAAEPVAKADPAEERLAASLKSFAQFKQEMAALLAELERLKKAGAEGGAELKLALEEVRKAKAALQRAEEELRTEKKARAAAEATVAEQREQLRAIARAMASAGLSAERLAAPAGKSETPPAKAR